MLRMSTAQLTREFAATKIQAATRGMLTRNSFKLTHLPPTERIHSRVFVLGNDPDINQLEKFRTQEKIAIIATSGLRILSLASQLSPRTKIILVDNSQQVCAFWQELKRFFETCTSIETFHQQFEPFHAQNIEMFRYGGEEAPHDILIQKHYQKTSAYFVELFTQHSYPYIAKLIKATTVICQSWADEKTFQIIARILTQLNITKVAIYGSNIIACIECPETREQILKNIEKLTPFLSIHTDLVEEWIRTPFFVASVASYPKEVYYFTKENHAEIAALLTPKSIEAPADVKFQIIKAFSRKRTYSSDEELSDEPSEIPAKRIRPNTPMLFNASRATLAPEQMGCLAADAQMAIGLNI